jgi:hypothetical protein
MFKILGLLSLSTAYSLSVMYFEGVKLGDLQVEIYFLLVAVPAENSVSHAPAAWLAHVACEA